MKRSLPLCLCAAALAVAGCNTEGGSNNAGSTEASGSADEAGNQTIAASVDENSRFFEAAKATGLDATLNGPGPYTVLVPGDDAFAQLEGSPLNDVSNAQNRAEITRILTYHILPGVILAEDISKAIDNSEGTTVLATMGGETLTAAKEGGNIVLTDSAGNKATIGQADEKASNGVVHRIDAVLVPPAPGDGEENAAQQQGQQAQGSAQGQQ